MVLERISTVVIFVGVLVLAWTIYRRRKTFRYPETATRWLVVLVIVDVIYLAGIFATR